VIKATADYVSVVIATAGDDQLTPVVTTGIRSRRIPSLVRKIRYYWSWLNPTNMVLLQNCSQQGNYAEQSAELWNRGAVDQV